VAPGHVNTLPLAPAGTPSGTTDVIFYRVYAAHGGAGQVSLPAITLTRNGESRQLGQCPASGQDQIPKSYCSIPWVAKGAPVCGVTGRASTSGAAGTIVPFARDPIGAGGTPDNDIAYLSATVAPRRNGDVLVIRAKAPATPSGTAPAPWPEPGTDLRYWSLCIDLAKPPVPVVVNRLPGGTADYGCRYDNQVALDGSGYYTFVIGTESQRAAIERIPGATFLPFSAAQPEQRYKLNMRNMLAERDFGEAVQDVPANGRSASAAAAMGPYYPRIAFCPLATLVASGPAVCMRASAPPSANANQATSSGHTVPALLFICAIAGWAVLEAWQVLRHRRNTGPAATSANRASLLIVVLGTIVAVAIAILAAAEVPAASVPGGLITFGIGLLIMCSGIFLRWWSVKTPGRPDQLVTTTGPYRFARHPSYLGFILALTGIGVVLDNWLSIAALALIPLIGLIYLIQVEEKHSPRP
jgi:protein-S-isoprenylcysteine O-methyltransferase Ste14